jgi:hypothetical protein
MEGTFSNSAKRPEMGENEDGNGVNVGPAREQMTGKKRSVVPRILGKQKRREGQ